jgi:hypothetical protein
MFADDTNVIIFSKSVDFSSLSDTILSHMRKWFTANNLTINLDETNVIKFITISHSIHWILVRMRST